MTKNTNAKTIRRALRDAGINSRQVSVIAYTQTIAYVSIRSESVSSKEVFNVVSSADRYGKARVFDSSGNAVLSSTFETPAPRTVIDSRIMSFFA